MKQKKFFFLGVITLVAILVGASVLYQQFGDHVTARGHLAQQGQSDADNEKELPPNFVVTDISGNEVSLSDFRGKPTVVNFWASWCGPCKGEMPYFDAVYRRMGDHVNFVMVNMTDGSGETVEKASKFIADSGYTFPVYYDTEYSAMISYGVYSLPTTYFFNAEGYAVTKAIGAIDEDTLLRGISMAITP